MRSPQQHERPFTQNLGSVARIPRASPSRCLSASGVARPLWRGALRPATERLLVAWHVVRQTNPDKKLQLSAACLLTWRQ